MYLKNTIFKDIQENMELGKPHILSFNEIKQAAERIEDGIIHTPLCVSILITLFYPQTFSVIFKINIFI